MTPDGDRADEQASETPESGDRTETPATAQHAIHPAVLELQHVFEVVRHPRRRYLLYALAETPEWTLTELATKLVAWEQDIGEGAVDAQQRDRMYVSLYHTHVPKLVDEGVVAFDPETETIERGPHAEQVVAVVAGAGSSRNHAQEQHASRPYPGGAPPDG